MYIPTIGIMLIINVQNKVQNILLRLIYIRYKEHKMPMKCQIGVACPPKGIHQIADCLTRIRSYIIMPMPIANWLIRILEAATENQRYMFKKVK